MLPELRLEHTRLPEATAMCSFGRDREKRSNGANDLCLDNKSQGWLSSQRLGGAEGICPAFKHTEASALQHTFSKIFNEFPMAFLPTL
jgi:hypothetical protein